MKALKLCGKIAAVILLVIVLFNQAMGIFSIQYGYELTGRTPPPEIKEATWLVPLWLITTVLVVATLILTRVCKKSEKLLIIPMVLGVVSAVLALVVALTFYGPYDMVLNSEGELAQTDWDWFWRHLSLVFVGLIPAVVSFFRMRALRNARIRKEESGYEEQFADEDFAAPADSGKSGKKLSKKQRKALREKEESGK